MKRGFLFLSACLFVGLAQSAQLSARPAGATQKLRAQLRPLANTIVEIIKEEKQTAIIVGEFISPPGFDANYGPGIQQLMIEELQALKPGVVKEADCDLSLTGKLSYQDEGEGDDRVRVIKVKVEIESASGKLIGKLAKDIRDQPQVIKDPEVIAAILAPAPIELPPKASDKSISDDIQRIANKPDFTPQGTRVRANEKSPFGIELLVSSRALPDLASWSRVPARAVKSKNGLPEVEVNRAEFYAVRVFNDTRHMVAVTLTIDGVDMFTFSEVRTPPGSKFPNGKPGYSHLIIPPGGAIIPGWPINNEKSESFVVTEYGKGISKHLKVKPNKPGVVTVTFALAWEGNNIPDEEKGSRSPGNETGRGPDVKNPLREVHLNIGVVREIDSVRYTR